MARHRTQLLLEAEQYRALSLLARRQGRSMSELVRQFVEQGLNQMRRSQAEKLKALDELAAIRQNIEKRLGVVAGHPLSDVRRDRERQLEKLIEPQAE